MAVEGFKNYERSSRVQVQEENYNRGMQYTNSPLDEGAYRLLVNYDLKENGKMLTSRQGLKTEMLGTVNPAYIDDFDLYNPRLVVQGAKEVVEENGKTYRQVVIANPDTKQVYMYTVNPETPDLSWMATLNKTISPAIFIESKDPEIHGMKVSDPNVMLRHAGAFAYNNSYYFFTEDGLFHTTFVDKNQSTGKPEHYTLENIPPKKLTPAESAMWGYNMLSPAPYRFNDEVLTYDAPIYLMGVLPYDSSGKIMVSPQVNQVIQFRCFYKGYPGKTYDIRWAWKEPGNSAWTTVKSETVKVSAVAPLLCSFSAPNQAIMLRVTATNQTDETDTQVMVIGFDFSKTLQGSAANSQLTTYDLTTSTCMAFWKNRLVLGLKNLLFLSEINDPSYFPYPNNMEPFDEYIIHIVPYLDNLLVFTNSKLYSITLNEDGLAWTVRNIQGNLTIKSHEIHLIQIVKNMVYFKSGNYYYMVVPKLSSTTGELTIAPISRPIEALLDDFKPAITKLLSTMYNYTGSLDLVYYHNFLDFEDIHNIYVFKTNKNCNVNIDLLYNTVLRTWRMYVYESDWIMKPFKQDATTKGTFMALQPITYAEPPNYQWDFPAIQFLKFNALDCTDVFVRSLNIQQEVFFKNYQLLDTGHRNIAVNLKKRYREAQLRLNNLSEKTLQFYTAFYIDGDNRKAFYKYTPQHELDPENPNYGLLTMSRELVDPSILPGTTMLAETAEDYNHWTLDVSRFPDVSQWKIRIPFSGKGYCPRMVLLSYNTERYELLNNVWVFRQLYSR